MAEKRPSFWLLIFTPKSPRKSVAGPIFVALLATITITGGGPTDPVSSVASAGTGAPSAGAVVNVGPERSSRAQDRLVQNGALIDAQGTDDSADCLQHSNGQIHDFFREHPCTALHRAYYRIRDREGHVVLVAVAWVQMPDETGARALKTLVDVHGTGDVTELSREQGRNRTVQYTGDFCSSRRDGTMVANARVQPVTGGTTDLALSSIASDAIG